MTSELLLVIGSVLAVGACGTGITVRVAKRSIAAAAILSPVTIVCSMAAGLIVGLKLMVIEGAGLTLLIIAASTPVALLVGIFVSLFSTRMAARVRDELEQERREREAEQARRELITGLSHDLRTPLAGICAMGEAIQDGVAPDPERYVQLIINEAERTATMLDDMMSLARLQTGRVTVDTDHVVLGDLVSDMVGQLQPLAASAHITVELDETRGGGAIVAGDPQLLNRVIQNVIANAIQYSETGATVTVAVYRDGEYGVLEVSDECGGLSDAEKQRMFDVGWKSDKARTPSCRAGSGFGLAIVKMIVAAHEGTVAVANVPGGCCMTIAVPLA